MSSTVDIEKANAKQNFEELQNKQSIRIRITLTSKLVKNIEAVCAAFVDRAKTHEVSIRGPSRLPTKVLRITTRKTPCGEGSKTWDRYELRIHKRVIDLVTAPSIIKELTNFKMEPGVDVEVTMMTSGAAN